MTGRRRVIPRAAAFAPALLALAVVAVPAAARQQTPDRQDETGRIAGRIIDAESGIGMAGVNIVVVEHGIAVVAGIDGRYAISNTPAGTVSVRAENLGYASKTITEVLVPAGGAIEVDIALEPSAIELAAITVTAGAERGSVARALDQQRQASNIVNAIAAEQIARSPDGDAGAAVRRVSGVTVQDGKYVFVRGLGERYTTTSLNGSRIPSPEPERRVVPFDLFPSSLLQTITTSKTFTPDQPADFSGGHVDIRTREFPGERQITFSASVGYQPGTTFASAPWAPFSDKEWLGLGTAPRKIPDAAVNMSPSAPRGPQINEVVNSFRNVWSVDERAARPNVSAGFSMGGSGDALGTRIGYIASGTYTGGQDVKQDFRRARVGGEGGLERDRYDGEIGTYDVLWGGILNVSALLGAHSRILLNNNYNRSAENDARIETGRDENSSSLVRVEQLRYVERSVRTNQVAGEHQVGRHRVDWALTSSAIRRDEPDRSEFVTWLDPEVPTWFNDFEGAVRTFIHLDESSLEGRLDYRFELTRTTGGAALRFGGLRRATERDASNRAYRMRAFFWSPTDPRWQLPPEEIFNGQFATDGDANFQIQPGSAGGTYTADDKLTAGYAMLELPIGSRLRLIGGARVERSELTVHADNTVGASSISERDDTDILPAVSLNFDLTETQKVRLSASQTLARPEYRELAPISYRDVLGGEQVSGNADLQRTLIQNYDLRWEWYSGPGQVVSVAGFYKKFTDPIEQRYFPTSGTDVRTFENAESAFNYGIEFEFVRDLGVLAEVLRPLTLSFNTTWMESEVETGREGDEPRAMVGQANWVVNGGLTWSDIRGQTSATLLYNAVGPRIVNARAAGTTVANVIEEPRHVLDLSLRFPLRGAASGKFDLKNLLDEPFEITQGEVTREFYRTGRSVSLGLTWRL